MQYIFSLDKSSILWYNIKVIFRWGISAAGSASHWQCGGQGFESPMLHQMKKPMFS